MNVGTIVSRVKRQFGDEAGVQVTDDDIYSWINEAQLEAVSQDEKLLTSIRLKTVQQAYTMDNAFPLEQDVLSVQDVRYTTADKITGYNNDRGDYLTYVDHINYKQYFDTSIDSLNKGTPVAYTIVSGLLTSSLPEGNTLKAIRLLPPADEDKDEQVLIVRYAKYPEEIDNSFVNTELPNYLNNYIINYCLMKAFAMDEDWNASQVNANKAQSSLSTNFARSDVNQGAYPTLNTLPGDR